MWYCTLKITIPMKTKKFYYLNVKKVVSFLRNKCDYTLLPLVYSLVTKPGVHNEGFVKSYLKIVDALWIFKRMLLLGAILLISGAGVALAFNVNAITAVLCSTLVWALLDKPASDWLAWHTLSTFSKRARNVQRQEFEEILKKEIFRILEVVTSRRINMMYWEEEFSDIIEFGKRLATLPYDVILQRKSPDASVAELFWGIVMKELPPVNTRGVGPIEDRINECMNEWELNQPLFLECLSSNAYQDVRRRLEQASRTVAKGGGTTKFQFVRSCGHT